MLRKKLKLSGKVSQSNEEVKKTEQSDNQEETEADNPKQDPLTSDEANSVQFKVTFELEFWEKIWKMEQELVAELDKINFKKDKNIAAIYNPLDYAADVHQNFMKKFLKKTPTVLFLGMNPGLLGMCQTSASDSIVFISH
jgi:hypothetical protein